MGILIIVQKDIEDGKKQKEFGVGSKECIEPGSIIVKLNIKIDNIHTTRVFFDKNIFLFHKLLLYLYL
jgi:hypothetical protein